MSATIALLSKYEPTQFRRQRGSVCRPSPHARRAGFIARRCESDCRSVCITRNVSRFSGRMRTIQRTCAKSSQFFTITERTRLGQEIATSAGSIGAGAIRRIPILPRSVSESAGAAYRSGSECVTTWTRENYDSARRRDRFGASICRRESRQRYDHTIPACAAIQRAMQMPFMAW